MAAADLADTDWAGIAAIEAINANTVDTPPRAWASVHKRLNVYDRLAGIKRQRQSGCSAGRAPIGRPTTVVHAAELSTPAILAGIRAGCKVFIDVHRARATGCRRRGRVGDSRAR